MSLVVKRFTATWCAPCRQLAPIMEQVKPKFPSTIFETIDVDENQGEAMKYGVRSIPTVVFVKDGVEVQRFTGVRPEHQIVTHINESL